MIEWNNIDIEQEVDQQFPMDTFRIHQRETIIKILESFRAGTNTVIMEAPTGSGKSAIAMTVARVMGQAYYLTSQKILQSTLENDFGDWCAVLKGRNAYRCWHISEFLKTNKYATADKGVCVRKNESKLDFCADNCEYQNALQEAESNPITVFNFSSFLFQRTMANRFTSTRHLLIADEAHNIEPQIMNFVEINISGDEIGLRLPTFDTPEEYKDYFLEINLGDQLSETIKSYRESLNKLKNTMSDEDLASDPVADELIKKLQKKESLLGKFQRLLTYIQNVECISELKDNVVTIKPLYASYHTPQLLLNSANYHLLMSATILNHKTYSHSIGVDAHQSKFIRVPHTFPVENRRIHLDYAGSMKYTQKQKTMPKMIDKIKTIMNRHKHVRGIIHCQSFHLMKQVINDLPRSVSKRFTHQHQYKNKDELLEMHENKSDSVIIAPAMHEGLDLKHELSRFQLILKVPFPSFKDNKQLQLRMKENWNYYLWLTALKLVQSYGRSIRSETDWAHTYVLDEDFNSFFSRADNVGLIPDWFIESLVIDPS